MRQRYIDSVAAVLHCSGFSGLALCLGLAIFTFIDLRGFEAKEKSGFKYLKQKCCACIFANVIISVWWLQLKAAPGATILTLKTASALVTLIPHPVPPTDFSHQMLKSGSALADSNSGMAKSSWLHYWDPPSPLPKNNKMAARYASWEKSRWVAGGGETDAGGTLRK